MGAELKLAQRLRLMSELATAVQQANQAICDFEVELLRRYTLRQSELCQFILQPRQCSSLDTTVQEPDDVNECRKLLEELARTQDKVRDFNRVQAALIRRGRRTADIFCRVLANSGVTYPPPRP